VRVESDNWVNVVANSILAAIVTDATLKGGSGPFSLDDLFRAWLEHDPETVATLPDPPGSTGSSENQRRTYWFYEGCRALEEDACIAEVGDAKFAVASLTALVARMLESQSPPPD
jgi:hypothetical protein